MLGFLVGWKVFGNYFLRMKIKVFASRDFFKSGFGRDYYYFFTKLIKKCGNHN